jgi:hypothetical protein
VEVERADFHLAQDLHVLFADVEIAYAGAFCGGSRLIAKHKLSMKPFDEEIHWEQVLHLRQLTLRGLLVAQSAALACCAVCCSLLSRRAPCYGLQY